MLNAESFERQGFSVVCKEDELTTAILIDEIDKLYKNRQQYIDKMRENSESDAIKTIVDIIEENCR